MHLEILNIFSKHGAKAKEEQPQKITSEVMDPDKDRARRNKFAQLHSKVS